MKLLITRPLRQAKKTAALLREFGHKTIIDPLLQVEQIRTALPKNNHAGIIVTSANALPALVKVWPETALNIPLLTTGQSTAEAAKDHGFTNCQQIQGSALKLIQQTPIWMKNYNIEKNAALLYPCAEEPAHNLEALLKTKNITCQPWQTYRTIPAQKLSTATYSAIKDGSLDGVVLYSSRTAKAFESLFLSQQAPSNPMHIFALSPEICANLSKNRAFVCHFPKNPDETALFGIINKVAQGPAG
ncbi:MAG: uroporphyrinogen-III synthase [Rhizobiaceae bacterium]